MVLLLVYFSNNVYFIIFFNQTPKISPENFVMFEKPQQKIKVNRFTVYQVYEDGSVFARKEYIDVFGINSRNEIN